MQQSLWLSLYRWLRLSFLCHADFQLTLNLLECTLESSSKMAENERDGTRLQIGSQLHAPPSILSATYLCPSGALSYLTSQMSPNALWLAKGQKTSPFASKSAPKCTRHPKWVFKLSGGTEKKPGDRRAWRPQGGVKRRMKPGEGGGGGGYGGTPLLLLTKPPYHLRPSGHNQKPPTLKGCAHAQYRPKKSINYAPHCPPTPTFIPPDTHT